MATLDDILTTQKNGVVAINNLSQGLNSFYEAYSYIAGQKTSGSITSTTAQAVASGSGRLASYVTTATGGATTGLIYDSVAYATKTTSGTGTVATIGYSGINAFSVGDKIAVYNVVPSGYNTLTATVTAVDTTNNTVSYANTTTGSMTTAGIILKIYDNATSRNLLLSSLSGTLGVYPVNVNFTYGLTVIPAASQYVTVTYSLL